MNTQPLHLTARGLLWLIVWMSIAVLGFEIAMMRILMVASWHHFAFLVISLALIGFGMSGTGLSLLRSWILPRRRMILFVLSLLTALSMPVCVAVAQHVPVEARFLPVLLHQQIRNWILFWTLLGLPFFLAASVICLCIMSAGDRVALLYGGNLIGSGIGSIAFTLAMWVFRPEAIPILTGAAVLVGVLGLTAVRPGVRLIGAATCAVSALGAHLMISPGIRPDPFKFLASVQRLREQQMADLLDTTVSPRATIEIYRSEIFHDVPFLGIGQTPPDVNIIVADGHPAGSMLRVSTPRDAGVVEHTMMAFPYALLQAEPRVLLLGESGGINAWLAVRKESSHVRIVQSDARLVELLGTERMKNEGAVFLDQPNMHVTVAQPRHFVEHDRNTYDLIQLVMLQSMPAGSGGVAGLGQDHLLTVQGIEACLRRLAPEGVLSTCRGIQTPPRDNVKLLATLIRAMNRIGIDQPESHIVIVRDYLAVCIAARRTPWTTEQIASIRHACRDRQLTPVWFTGIETHELNRPDAMPGPDDAEGDWYHYAARELFSTRADALIDNYVFDIRPPTDDRPFFFDFFRWRSIDAFEDAFGDLWLTRTEIAFLFVLVAMVIIAACGALLTILPLLAIRRTHRGGGRWATVSYFAAIGLAYMLLEITVLSRAMHIIGDPVTAAAVTITAFLVFSGVGSIIADRARPQHPRSAATIILSLILMAIVTFPMLAWSTRIVGPLPWGVRCVATAAMVGPLAVLMGFPMPTALRRLDAAAPALVPWAWGVNAFASVLAAPLAIAIGMSVGFTAAAVAAAAGYLVAAAFYRNLPCAALNLDREN